jgi:aryl sulfotransferase
VTYIVTGRHPLDAAVSLYHQANNIDRSWLRQLTGRPKPAEPPPPRMPLRDWLLGWVAADEDPRARLDSLPGVMLHMSDAWARRGEPNVILVHYDDLIADLDGRMRWLAGRLAITVPEPAWPALVHAATFESMRAEVASHPPSRGVLKDPAEFFRRGSSGAAREVLTDQEIAVYHARAAQLASPELLGWLHAQAAAIGDTGKRAAGAEHGPHWSAHYLLLRAFIITALVLPPSRLSRTARRRRTFPVQQLITAFVPHGL